MTARRMAWVTLSIAWLAMVAGCGSESTGRTSPEAVERTAREFGGPDVKLYASQVMIRSAADGQWRHIVVVTACRPDGDCTIIAPDGVSYAVVRSFVDDNKAIEPGDVVLANPDLASPDTPAPARLEEFTKSSGPPWVWMAGGGASAVVVLLTLVWLVRRRRRRIDNRTVPGVGES